MAELEEEKKSYSALAADRDGARTEARKLQKRLECLQRDLRVSKQRSNELKAQLSLSDELKVAGTGVSVQIKSRGLFTS